MAAASAKTCVEEGTSPPPRGVGDGDEFEIGGAPEQRIEWLRP